MQDDLYFSMKLMELSRSFKDQMGKLDHDIPFALRQICLYVQQHPGCCQEDIASELMMDKSLLARNVRKAQQMGLLKERSVLWITEEWNCICVRRESPVISIL